MKVLFLSHAPHEAHLNFAKSIDARVQILPLDIWVRAIKKLPFLRHFYPFISLVCNFIVRTDHEDILFVDGGSSLFVGVFLKMRMKNVKLIYLDGDLLFYNLHLRTILGQRIGTYFINKIDGAICVSTQNQKTLSSLLNIPTQVCNPYPQPVRKTETNRLPYGLYVGRLDPEKNIKRIIEFGLECPYFERFVVIGRGTLKRYVSHIARRNKKLLFLGERSDVEYWYNTCKFLIHIPDCDPYPCTTMEAALCGCFPIISRGVGTSELFDTMFVVEEPNKFSVINDTIEYIIQHGAEAENKLQDSLKRILTKDEALLSFQIKFNQIVNQLLQQ